MKIIITGSRGFIGTHLKNSLQDHDIVEWDTKIDKDIKSSKLPDSFFANLPISLSLFPMFPRVAQLRSVYATVVNLCPAPYIGVTPCKL